MEKIIQIGKIGNPKYSIAERVFDIKGICPTLVSGIFKGKSMPLVLIKDGENNTTRKNWM